MYPLLDHSERGFTDSASRSMTGSAVRHKHLCLSRLVRVLTIANRCSYTCLLYSSQLPPEEDDDTVNPGTLQALYLEPIPTFRLVDVLLLERDIVIIGTRPQVYAHDHKVHIRAMQDFYNNITGFVAIQEWDTDVRIRCFSIQVLNAALRIVCCLA